MILEFSVTNFRSLRDEQMMTLVPGTIKKNDLNTGGIAFISDKVKVLKSAIILGANASGKSNFLLAIDALRQTVLDSAGHRPQAEFKYYDPFIFDKVSEGQPTTFEIYFLLHKIVYKYKVSFNRNEVLYESLYFVPNGREAKLFERKKDKYTYGVHWKGNRSIIEQITGENQLFLSKGALNNVKLLAEVFGYFERGFITHLHTDAASEAQLFHQLKKQLYHSPSDIFRDNVKFILQSFDVDVADFRMVKTHDEYSVFTTHEIIENKKVVGTKEIPLAQESEGTQRLFHFGIMLTQVLMTGQTILLDEFNNSLHAFVSRHIVNIFNNPDINTKNAQLVLATHESHLMHEDVQLRRDQIWLMQKYRDGASELYCVYDMEGVTPGISLDTWYTSGLLGSVQRPREVDYRFKFKQNDTKKEMAAVAT